MLRPARARALVLSALLVACSKEAKPQGASPEATSSSTLAGDAMTAPSADAFVPEPPAVDADLVRRFPDEERLDHPKERLVHGPAIVRLDPASTRRSAFLPSSTEVVLVARAKVDERSWVLVSYGNPFDKTARLNGWVPHETLSGEPPRNAADGGSLKAPRAAARCAKGEVLVWGEVATCERACSDDSGCGGGDRCFGVAPELVNGGLGKFASFCVGPKSGAAK